MKSVQVLVSTYNGKKYIKEQVDSILKQRDVKVYCLIRDDGSTDSTLEILEKLKINHENIKIIKGKNIGYEHSFMELVKQSGDYDYYAFSDQDDVWLPNKLIEGINKLITYDNNIPLLYHSNADVVNPELNYICKLRNKNPFNAIEKRFLFNGFVLGCTSIFNQNTKKLVMKGDMNLKVAHDFWIPILCVLVGKVIYDPNSYILYRQHEDNVFGYNNSFFKIFKCKYKEFFSNERICEKVAKSLLIYYCDILKKEDIQMIQEIAYYRDSIINKLKLLFSEQATKPTIRGTIYLKFAILFSKI